MTVPNPLPGRIPSPVEVGGVPARRALVVRLGGQVLALAAGSGGRVVEIEACTRVPTGPDYLIGVGNGQGVVLAVVDIRPLLGLPIAPWSWPLLAQIAGGEHLRVAFAVEEVLGLEELGADRLQPPGSDLPSGLRAFSQGLLAATEGPAVLLDVPRIIDRLRLRSPERDQQREGGSRSSGPYS